jgi:uncharacterized phiE125 gp8 family phage protein
MTRAIIVPPSPAPEALGELKQWLALTGTREDAMLDHLIGSALELCEGFTGQLLLEATCEEVLSASPTWQPLATRPVQAIVAVQSVPAEGARTTLATGAYAIELDSDGGARVRVANPGAAGRIAVRFVAGLAPNWNGLPESLRHGVIRLAAHQHRMRETSSVDPVPPAAVTALWRPWRRMRLA